MSISFTCSVPSPVRLEIHKYIKFSQERFPDPKSLVEDLHQSGFKAIWMIDPGIKSEKGYFVYDSGSEKDVWIQTADGKPYVGKQFLLLYT